MEKGKIISDIMNNKKKYESHVLIPTKTLDEPKLEEIPFPVSFPRIHINAELRTISCVYPESRKKGEIYTQDKEVVFNALLPSTINEHNVKIKQKNCAEFYLQ